MQTLKCGESASALRGQPVSNVLRVPAVHAAVAEALALGEGATVEFSLSRRIERFFEARVEPVARQGGAHDAGRKRERTAVLIIVRDVTAARRHEQMRSDFVANVSHELRTPLSSLLGFTETLRGIARDDPEATDRFLALMETQAARMARIVDDLLSLSRIEMREHTRPDGVVDMAGVLKSVVDILAPQAAARDMELALGIEDHLPTITGDRDELTRLMQNLVENAIKYGRAGTPVEIDACAEGDGLRIAVADSGEGIAEEHLPRLTERFYRVDAARSRAVGGTGLGLAIVKHVLNRHRGELRVESTVGKGSTFTAFLPARDKAARTRAAG